jgi:class 3 adenylate cyclase
MAKDRLPDKLAVLLHADVAGSTQLVQQDEHLAHERIQDSFRRFGDTIEKYRGRILELRGDALLAESMGCHREMTNVDLWAKVSKPGSLTNAQHIELMSKLLQAYS